MERVDEQGNILGFSVREVSRLATVLAADDEQHCVSGQVNILQKLLWHQH